MPTEKGSRMMAENGALFIGAGNALLDLAAEVPEGFAAAAGMVAGGVFHVEPARIRALIRRVEERGGTIVRVSAGGGAAVAARVAASLGLDAQFRGAVGADEEGEAYRTALARSGVHAHLHESPLATGIFLMLRETAGQTTRVVAPGAAFDFPVSCETGFDAGRTAILHVDALLELPAAGRLLRMIDAGRSAGMLVSLDLSTPGIVRRRRESIRGVMGHCHVVFGNEAEWEALCISDLQARFPTMTIVRKRGASGVEAFFRGKSLRIEAPRGRVVDEIGAGDAFAAAFMAGMAGDRALEACLAMGREAARVILGEIGTGFTPGAMRDAVYGSKSEKTGLEP